MRSHSTAHPKSLSPVFTAEVCPQAPSCPTPHSLISNVTTRKTPPLCLCSPVILHSRGCARNLETPPLSTLASQSWNYT